MQDNNTTLLSYSQLPKSSQGNVFEDEIFWSAYLNPQYNDLGLELLKTPIPPYARAELPSCYRNARMLGDLGISLKFAAGLAMMMDKSPETLIDDLKLMAFISIAIGGEG